MAESSDTPQQAKSPSARPTHVSLERATWAIVLVAVTARVVRYAANRSLWRDEAALALNLIDRSFAELAGPLDDDQMAPVGFLWLVRLSVIGLGEHEYALRLVPLLAGLASIFVFRAVVREILQPREALLALAFFCIAEPLIHYASEAKQYASDVLIALLILWPAVRIVRRGATTGRLAALAAGGGLGVWFSLPAVFVCAGVGLALAHDLWRKRARAIAPLLGTAGVVVLWSVSFALAYGLVIAPQGQSAYLAESWARYFAPPPLPWGGSFGWYRRTFFGFFNDPLGLPATGVAALVFLAGCVRLRRRDATLLLLLLGPVAFALLASMLGLVPFPASDQYHLVERYYPFFGRLILFAVPLALPPVAAGLVSLLELDARRTHYVGWIAAAMLLAAPVHQFAANLASPPRIHEFRPVSERLAASWREGDRIFVQQHATAPVRYYLRQRGLPDPDAEIVYESREDGLVLALRMAGLGPDARLWMITLHHPHWRSRREQELILELLDEVGERVESLEDHNVQALLYRIRKHREAD
jgi:hypothetical protein